MFIQHRPSKVVRSVEPFGHAWVPMRTWCFSTTLDLCFKHSGLCPRFVNIMQKLSCCVTRVWTNWWGGTPDLFLYCSSAFVKAAITVPIPIFSSQGPCAAYLTQTDTPFWSWVESQSRIMAIENPLLVGIILSLQVEDHTGAVGSLSISSGWYGRTILPVRVAKQQTNGCVHQG